jgi:hypothetical protein
MALRLVQVNVKTRDDAALGRFWADALGWGTSSEGPGVTNVEPVGFVWPDPAAVCVDVVSVPDPRDGEVPLSPRSRHHGVGRGRSLNRAESLGAGSTTQRGTDARDPAWGGRPGSVERSESAGDQGGPLFGRCLIAHEHGFRLPAARRSLLEAIEPIIGARASGIRRVEASRGRLPRWSTHAHLPADTLSSTIQLVHNPRL